MNLVVDIGNTNAKLGLFESNTLKKFLTCKSTLVLRRIKTIIKFSDTINNVVISSVAHVSGKPFPEFQTLKKLFNSGVNILFVDHKTPLPIKNLYLTPHTLGTDRLAVAVAAHKLFPRSAALVLNAGTCITFDFINKKGHYSGGSISPGIGLRFKALNKFTGRLPLIKGLNTMNNIKLTGNTTHSSLMSGVMHGALAEVAGMAGDYADKYPDLNLIVTGGDMKIFFRKLSCSPLSKKINIFADRHLVLKGLDEIIKFNII